MAIHIHQIFYDDRSRAAVHPDLIPLDNTGGRADWFEFWPIRDYLRRTPLVEGDWYGFLSTKFADKYCDPAWLRPIIEGVPDRMDVVLFSPAWDQSAYFLNCFEQAEHWTIGVMDACQKFLDHAGIDLNVKTQVGTIRNTVFGNYVVARPAYWREWLALADKLVECTERGPSPVADLLNRPSSYFSSGKTNAPMKVFVQERLASVVLARSQFTVGIPDTNEMLPITAALFSQDAQTRELLLQCDAMKTKFLETRDPQFLAAYAQARRAIRTHVPMALHAEF